MTEAATNGEHRSRTGDASSELPPAVSNSKRKPDSDPQPLAAPADDDLCNSGSKKLKPLENTEIQPSNLSPDGKEEGEEGKGNGNTAADKGKRVLTAVDKGKGIMVEEEDEEEKEEEEEDDDDGSSDDDSGDEIVGLEGEDSDFSDDPLAEVDLSNILPSRTRRRAPPPPGAYLVPNQHGDDSDDSE